MNKRKMVPFDQPDPVARNQVGALCWRMHRGQLQVLLITSRDTGRWVIPKGWPMPGMTEAAAAATEAWEEAGVEGTVSDLSIGAFSYDKLMDPEPPIPCVVAVYHLRVLALARVYPERHQRRRKWFRLKDAQRQLDEPELRALLAVFSATPGG